MSDENAIARLANVSPTTMTTYTGASVDVFDPKVEDIHLADIAHALSNLCRFTGHTRFYYSVAQHCVYTADHLMMENADVQTQRLGLLHDAAEAYLNDLARPLKRGFKQYQEVENRMMGVIVQRFGLSGADAELVKYMDDVMVSTEGKQLMPNYDQWLNCPEPLPLIITSWHPVYAKAQFLVLAERLEIR